MVIISTMKSLNVFVLHLPPCKVWTFKFRSCIPSQAAESGRANAEHVQSQLNQSRQAPGSLPRLESQIPPARPVYFPARPRSSSAVSLANVRCDWLLTTPTVLASPRNCSQQLRLIVTLNRDAADRFSWIINNWRPPNSLYWRPFCYKFWRFATVYSRGVGFCSEDNIESVWGTGVLQRSPQSKE